MEISSRKYQLRNLGLPVIQDLSQFSEVIRISESTIRKYIGFAECYYLTYEIPKKSGGARLIAQPCRKLKAIQSWILRNILDKLFSSVASTGFEIGSSIYDNAYPHIGSNVILAMDLDNFFPSIPANKVYGVFYSLGYPKNIASALTSLCAYKGFLPQGSPASPKLANLVCSKLDARIQGYAGKKGITYTRYADDSAPRRRTGGRRSSVQPCCTRDEGGPFGVAVQAETSNHLLLLHLRGVVVSESGKGRARPCQIRTVESNANEPLMTCRKRRNDVKTGRESLARDKSGSNLFTGQTASGIKVARTRFRLLCGTWEPVTPMLREKHKERSSKCQSTEAGYRGGVTRISEEGSVMELERRGYPIQSEKREQPAMGGLA